jgi:hypothetical protein
MIQPLSPLLLRGIQPIRLLALRLAFAPAILFGPGGLLYMPITGSEPQTTRQVRRCRVSIGPAGRLTIRVPCSARPGGLRTAGERRRGAGKLQRRARHGRLSGASRLPLKAQVGADGTQALRISGAREDTPLPVPEQEADRLTGAIVGAHAVHFAGEGPSPVQGTNEVGGRAGGAGIRTLSDTHSYQRR